MTKENIRKLLLAIIFVLILIVIALFIGKFTYSYLGPAPTDELTGTGEVTPSGDTIIFSKGNDLSLSASTDNFHTGSGNLTDTTNPQVRLIASSDTNNASTTYYAGIRIYENTYTYSSGTTAELILSVYDENGTLLEASSDTLSFVEVGGVKGFDITGLTGAYNIAIDHPISTTSSTNGTTHTWTFTLTFVNLDTDQSINETANLEMEVVLQKDRIEMPTIEEICSDDSNASLLACHVLSQYTGTDGENGLYYHDADLENGAGDNSYRYAGANPNNYVCFGSDAATCPSDNLYRIIGVFGSKVKLIKADYPTTSQTGTGGAYCETYANSGWSTSYYKGNQSLSSVGTYYWNPSGTNTWSSSSLVTTNLNNTFLNSLSSTWQNRITTHTWYVGGHSTSSATPKEFYNAESSGTTWSGKIGLMYVSDYGYAASNSAWTTNMSSYNSLSITSNNWMYMGLLEWTISRYSANSAYVFNMTATGGFNDNDVDNYAIVVRPSFYLTSSTSYVSGSGTSADPIRIS